MILKRSIIIETVADLVERLGGIPLQRIRLYPRPGTATEADLLHNTGPICELIEGVLVEKAMGDRESLLGTYIASLIWRHVEANDLGVVIGEAGHIRVSPTQVRAPDATFIPWSSFPDEELPQEAFWSVAPGLVVEMLSPGNTTKEIDRKLNDVFSVGCKLAWVINPRTKTARVHTSAKKYKELDSSGTLDGGKVLPGFKLSLTHLFAVGKKRRPR